MLIFIVPLVQSLSFFQSVQHSEGLINNYKALMSPFHIKLFRVYNKSFSFSLFFYTLSIWFWNNFFILLFNSLSPLIFLFRQLFILFDYQLSTHGTFALTIIIVIFNFFIQQIILITASINYSCLRNPLNDFLNSFIHASSLRYAMQW
jgi:hypothetical protein